MITVCYQEVAAEEVAGSIVAVRVAAVAVATDATSESDSVATWQCHSLQWTVNISEQ